MIYATDVVSIFSAYDASGVTETTYPFRLKAIILYPAYNVFGGIALHDGTSSSDPLKFEAGLQAFTSHYFSPPMIRIPGNGIKFDVGLRVEYPNDYSTGSDSLTGVTLFIQRG